MNPSKCQFPPVFLQDTPNVKQSETDSLMDYMEQLKQNSDVMKST